MTGMIGCQWPSSHTTTMFTLPPSTPHSLSTQGNILVWGLNLCDSPLKSKQCQNSQITWRTPSVKHNAALAKSKDNMAHYYNQHHKPAPIFAAGDMVFLHASNIHTMYPSKKLLHCFLGPFVVVQPVGLHAYHLWLPSSMLHIHPVFYVVKLMPVPEDPISWQVQPLPAPTVIGGEQHYKVESILDSRLKAGRLEFLVS